MVWVFSAFLVFLILILFFGWRHQGKIPQEFAGLTNDPGITFKRAVYPRRGAGTIPPFIYGSCFEGIYRDTAVAASTVINAEDAVLGTRLTFSFTRPLTLSLFCASGIDIFSASPVADEFRDIYLKRIDTGITDLKAWAKETDKAMMLLRGGDAATHLEHLADHFRAINERDHANLPGLRRGGFMVNDQGVTLFTTASSLLTRELIEEAFRLSQALSAAGYGMPGRSKTSDGALIRGVMILLVIAFVGFIMGVMILGLLQ